MKIILEFDDQNNPDDACDAKIYLQAKDMLFALLDIRDLGRKMYYHPTDKVTQYYVTYLETDEESGTVEDTGRLLDSSYVLSDLESWTTGRSDISEVKERKVPRPLSGEEIDMVEYMRDEIYSVLNSYNLNLDL